MTELTPRGRRGNAAANRIKFDQRLVLTNWMLNLFDAASFKDLGESLRDPLFEGFNEDGVSRFYQCLNSMLDRPELSNDILLAYDGNIVRHWKKITAKRNADGQTLYPKYFQYLSLLFTEIYLDRYFRDPDCLLSDLNAYAQRFNRGDTRQQKAPPGELFAAGLPKGAQIKRYIPQDLRKLAFWSATGSGKTLLMHAHILQYRHYQQLKGAKNDINKIILLTPNDGLSRQHLNEFRMSGIFATLFNKNDGGLFTGKGANVDIIDIHKLRETSGEKTVSVEAFGSGNLVLVDEGHRGTSGSDVGHWMKMRNHLCEKGFSFEYSATFGQAIKAGNNKNLAHEYAKCILFDYSYKYFYKDGYGKEYHIMNLEDDSNEEHRRRYLTACLLAFYQQLKLFADKREELRRFLIEKPLWIFVGGSVTKTPRKKDISDVLDILLFLARFVKNRSESIRCLDMLLGDLSGLHDLKGRELFVGAFTYLGKLGLSGEQLFQDILASLFNAQTTGALHVRRLKAGGEGEISLHIGEDNEPFGLINVGDSSGLCKLCEKRPEELAVSESEFSTSLFHGVNSDDSTLNILIGSKKFSEGWSSWRVSTMGLMNIGKKEGSQIIQLFGRGVRLKGVDFCLKRSHRFVVSNPPKDMERLETLNVFGVHADYMRQFKEYLEDEGLSANDERIEIFLPVVKTLGEKQLKTIQLKDGVDFKKQGPKPTLGIPDEHFKKSRLVVDWHPRIRALASSRGQATPHVTAPNEEWFTADHLAFLDIEKLYFDLQKFKSERAWHNLNLNKNRISDILIDHSWYVIHIPQEEMAPRSFKQIHHWQEIASTLLHKFCDRFYKVRKAEFEKDHLEYRMLTEDDRKYSA